METQVTRVMMFALANAVEHLFDSVKFELHALQLGFDAGPYIVKVSLYLWLLRKKLFIKEDNNILAKQETKQTIFMVTASH